MLGTYDWDTAPSLPLLPQQCSRDDQMIALGSEKVSSIVAVREIVFISPEDVRDGWLINVYWFNESTFRLASRHLTVFDASPCEYTEHPVDCT